MTVSRVWVFAELQEGKVTSGSLELLTKARELGDTVEAVILGANAGGAVAELGNHGASTVYVGDDGAYDQQLIGGPGADALAQLVGQHHPDLILFNGSYAGRDVAGRLAAKLDVALIANLTGVEASGSVTVSSSIFGAQKRDNHVW